MDALVIIDVQRDFRRAGYYALPGIFLELEKSKIYNDRVILVDYDGCGKILPELIKKCDDLRIDYDVATKTINSAFYALEKLRYFKYINMFKICGVNTNACVRETVRDLQKNNRNVHLLMHGCFDAGYTYDAVKLNDLSEKLYQLYVENNTDISFFTRDVIHAQLIFDSSERLKISSLANLTYEEINYYFQIRIPNNEGLKLSNNIFDVRTVFVQNGADIVLL